MSMAICFKCGSAKSGAMTPCRTCNVAPRINSQYAVSLALSTHLSTKDQLAQYSHELRIGKKLSLPREVLVQALKALKDPQLLAILGVQSQPVALVTTLQPTQASPGVPQIASPISLLIKQEPRPTTTALHQSAFAILGATTRDNRKRIVELAEEKSLEFDHDVCQKARADLTNSRIRLSAEIAWLPGVSPSKASQLLESLSQDPMAIREKTGLPTLAHLNLLIAAFESIDGEVELVDLVGFIMETAYLVEELSQDNVLRDINEDRAVSGFTEVRALDLIEAELAERKRYYRNVIMDSMNRLPFGKRVQVMTEIVDVAISGGKDLALGLINDLVDSYEVETQGMLQAEVENVNKLIKMIREHADSGETAIQFYVDKLDEVTRNWYTIAKPIQLSSTVRGIYHEVSRDLAREIRNLAVDLFNEHDMLTQFGRLTVLIEEFFSKVPGISDKIEEDMNALSDILQQLNLTAAQEDEWAREITYSAKIGVIFKSTLSISPQGISWKNIKFPLDSITRVRWGGTKHSYNGIPTGTIYTIAFGNQKSEAVVQLQKRDIFNVFTEKLWPAVCVRLLGEMLETLKDGHELPFGAALLHDDGITLVKHKLLRSNERVRCAWSQVNVWSADGSFYIGARDDKNVYEGLSYIHNANTHILELAIRKVLEKPSLHTLSELLD